MNIKKQLLESLIRVCAKEVLSQLNEAKKKSKKCKCGKELILGTTECKECMEEAGLTSEAQLKKGETIADTSDKRHTGIDKMTNDENDPTTPEIKEEDSETVGAAQAGSGDSVDIETDTPKIDTEPTEKETPTKKEKLKGIVLLTPEGELRSVPFRQWADDASIERTLFRVGSSIGGKKVKIAISTMNKVRKGMSDKTPTYVFLGKYDPNGEELFVMADRDLNSAKEQAAKPEEISGDESSEINPDNQFITHAADDEQWGKHLSGADKPHNEIPDDNESGQD